MTMTVKLPPELEHHLRQRSLQLGQPAGALMRLALNNYLDAAPDEPASAFALGSDVFGRHRGATDLSSQRKSGVIGLWDDKHAARAVKAPVSKRRG